MGLQDDQEVSTKKTEESARSRRSRWQTRVDRLSKQNRAPSPGAPSQIVKAMAALRQVYAAGPQPDHILVRESFIRRRHPAKGVMSDAKRPREPEPPMLAVASPNGIAQQLELICLFVAQCRPAGGPAEHLRLPLEATTSDDVGWLDLVVPAVKLSSPTTKVIASSPKDARLRQLKKAIGVLADKELVRLTAPPGARNRFEGFRLLDEGGARPTGDPIPYQIPDPNREKTVQVPADFFLQGWVYTLFDSESALWLMLAHQRANQPVGSAVAVSGEDRLRFYGLTKDAYQGWWLFDLVDLLDVEVDPNRRADGTVDDFDEGRHPALHRFTLRDSGFAQPAANSVLVALDMALKGEPVGLRRNTIDSVIALM